MKNYTIKSLLFATICIFGFSAAASAAEQITVRKGDSLYKIAQRYKVSFADVLRLNTHFDNQHLIYPGEKVYIPDGSHGQSTSNASVGKGNASVIQSEKPAQAEAILNLVNAERKKAGLSTLELDETLTSIANTKAADMMKNNYFSHTSPTYGTPFEMMKHFGVNYKSAGENIAAGQKTSEQVMSDWMNSSGHRANILSPSYDTLGVGYSAGGSQGSYWVQMLIKK